MLKLFTSLQNQPWVLGLVAGIIITAFNTFGALLVFFSKKEVSQKTLDISLGFAAGLMLSASFTSLILPGIQKGGVVPVVIGIALGALFFDWVDHHIPHTHFAGRHEGGGNRIGALWLFIIAITIHNLPEGLSVGIAMGSKNFHQAIILMLAIGLQNIPEGFSVAFTFFANKMGNKVQSVWMGIKSGLVEIPLAMLGAFLVSWMHFLLPYAMGFGAGAMLYVVNDEIIPETHKKGHERLATFGIIFVIILMLVLDMMIGT